MRRAKKKTAAVGLEELLALGTPEVRAASIDMQFDALQFLRKRVPQVLTGAAGLDIKPEAFSAMTDKDLVEFAVTFTAGALGWEFQQAQYAPVINAMKKIPGGKKLLDDSRLAVEKLNPRRRSR